ncbi:low-density lipoprotein receptor-related protein 6-like [Diadema antillarum]|uniref:low-density lipoprotein receptor-related protein 6-like n=1 Tax=Diadema antillarum TaxID=105358 RepID=UPI003A857129
MALIHWTVISLLWSLSTVLQIDATAETCSYVVEAGAGTIRSPNYPSWYPPSQNCTWVIRGSEGTRIRIRFFHLDIPETGENCTLNSLRFYDGPEASDSVESGRFCGLETPSGDVTIQSTSRFLTVRFTSDFEGQGQGFLISYEIVDDNVGSRIVFTASHPQTREARLSSLPADPRETFSLDGSLQQNVSIRYFFNVEQGNWGAVATRYGQQQILWFDGGLKRILKGHIGPQPAATALIHGTSSQVNGVCVDWLTGNVYRTDATYDWIVLFNADGTRQAVVVDEDLDEPFGIAVHPLQGFLFWTDTGQKPKVERSDLAGGHRVKLITSELVAPRGITVDYTENKLYWVDADPEGNKVEVCDIMAVCGSTRRELYRVPGSPGFYDLTIFSRFLYVTGNADSTIHMVTTDTGEFGFTLNLPLRPFGIVTYAPDAQPQTVSPCSSNPCSYLCVDGGPGGYTCLCGSGQLLNSDRTTCVSEGAISPPKLFVVSRTQLSSLPANFPDMSLTAGFRVSPFLLQRSHAVALAVDLEDGLLLYSDVGRQVIGRATLRNGSRIDYVTGATSSVEGMAVDWLTKTLYWTDNPRGTIEVSRYDGSFRTILLKDNVLRPRNIVIDAKEKFMFWIEIGPPSQIERASLDGTSRRIIVTADPDLQQPGGLVIDYKEKRLYCGDIPTGVIYSMDYDGENRRSILTKVGAFFFDMAIFKDYIMWTDLRHNGIYVGNKKTGEPVQAYLGGEEQFYGIKMYADTRQTVVHNPCRLNNGECQQLCLGSQANSRGYVCHCIMGYRLANDGKSCVSDMIADNFLLVSDTYHQSIYQVGLESAYQPQALPITIPNPVGVSYDPVEEKVYWSDVKFRRIGRASLDGSQQELFDNTGYADSLAVDSVSRLLYWADVDQSAIIVASLDGSNRKTLVTGLKKPRSIALHPVDGIMFWADWQLSPRIEGAYMDGNMRRSIVTGNLKWPNGLAIDYKDDLLYWCDGGTGRIESTDLSGRGRRVIIALGSQFHPFGIGIVDQHVFWTDWRTRKLSKADKRTGRGNITVGPNDYTRPNALFAVTTTSLPSGTNVCSENNGQCSTLCLPTPTGRTCACADDIELASDSVTCISDVNVECPFSWHYGGVAQSCDRQPGSNCSVLCYSGHVPAVNSVSCLHSGVWDVDPNSICIELECAPLEVPAHAVSTPCYPPFIAGKLCRHDCQPGYIRSSGMRRRVCGHEGQWMGTPLVCVEFVEPTNEPASCNSELEFVDVPKDLSPVQNDLVQQYCSVNQQQVDITWYKDGTRLTSGSLEGVFILPTDDLLIPGFQSSHQGRYACVASFAGTECLRVEVDMFFDPYRHFEVFPTNASLEADGHHLFECQAKSALDTVTWRKDDSLLVETDQVIVIAGGALLLRNLVEDDSGKYTCRVSDQQGNVKGTADAWLTVTRHVDIPSINITEVCGTVVRPDVVEVTTPSAANEGGRIVGGSQAERGSAPYMGRIWRKDRRTFICGATLLNQRWALTAAHCITLYNLQSSDILLYFGDHDSLNTEDSQVMVEVASIIQHEDFNDNTFDKDIALIGLKQPFAAFTDYIRPICLPPRWLSKLLLRRDNIGRVTGWGQIAEGGPYPRYLTEVYLPVVKTKKCKTTTNYDVTANMFCAGYARVEKDACQGDSGGPFAMLHEGRWYQIGIVSWGEGCAQESKYGYYSRISRFLPWIERHISN